MYKTVKESTGLGEDEYNSVKLEIERTCTLRFGCPLRDLPEICVHFRLLIDDICENKNNKKI